MAREIELKLGLPPEAGAKVCAHPLLQGVEVRAVGLALEGRPRVRLLARLLRCVGRRKLAPAHA